MELRASERELLTEYLDGFTVLTGDERTARLLAGTVLGIIGSERLVCSRIAAFSP